MPVPRRSFQGASRPTATPTRLRCGGSVRERHGQAQRSGYTCSQCKVVAHLHCHVCSRMAHVEGQGRPVGTGDALGGDHQRCRPSGGHQAVADVWRGVVQRGTHVQAQELGLPMGCSRAGPDFRTSWAWARAGFVLIHGCKHSCIVACALHHPRRQTVCPSPTPLKTRKCVLHSSQS